jgi:hypothetical protein
MTAMSMQRAARGSSSTPRWLRYPTSSPMPGTTSDPARSARGKEADPLGEAWPRDPLWKRAQRRCSVARAQEINLNPAVAAP